MERMTGYNQLDQKQHEKEFSDFCEQLLFRKSNHAAIYTGSFFELPLMYFLETFTDVDSITYRRNICAIKKGEPTPKEFQGTVLIIHTEGSHHGYARLYSKSHNVPYTYAIIPEEMPAQCQVLLEISDISTGFLNNSTYVSKFLTNFHGLTRDIVEAIWCPNWPQVANEWKRRERRNGWPLPCTVENIVNNGCFLVAKPHKESQYVGNEWRFSFSEAELLLIHTWNHVQMYIYHILRLIKSDVVNTCGGKGMTFLTTYHFKTLMLWACEEKTKEFWSPDKVQSSIQELILDMIELLIEKQCRNYFMPGNNMLDHLPDTHNFEREVQFLMDSAELVHVYISNSVPATENRLKESSMRISINMLLLLQLKISFFYTVDPSKPRRQRYIPSSAIENSHLFRSNFINLFKCLVIHRRLGLEDFEVKLDGMCEVLRSIEDYFRSAHEEHFDGFTYVDISPMENAHTIIAKMLKVNIDSNGRKESTINNRQEADSNFVDRKSTRSEIFNWKSESVERSEVVCLAQMLLDVMNEQIEKPLCFHTAAYEANFYWTIYGDERNDIAVESHKRALNICNKWLSYADSIKNSLTFKFGCGLQGFPIIISNGWSMIFDKYIKVVLGFLSLVKAVTNSRSRSNYKLSDGETASYVIVHVYPIEFLRYISDQCQIDLKNNCRLDYSFEFRDDIAGLFLSAAIRIITKLFEESTEGFVHVSNNRLQLIDLLT